MSGFFASMVSSLPPSLAAMVGQERRPPKSAMVALPVVGDVSMDVLLFAGSSIVFSLYRWWNKNSNSRGRIGGEPYYNNNKPRQSTLEAFSTATLFSLPASLAFFSSTRTTTTPATVNLFALGQISVDVLFFVGSAVSFRIFLWLKPERGDVRDVEQEAADYSLKKTNGFKDPGLYEFMDTCMDTKQSLRKVQDPEETRKKKLDDILQADKAKPKGPLQLSPRRLEHTRKGLHRVQTTKSAVVPKSPNRTEEMLAGEKRRLRAVQ